MKKNSISYTFGFALIICLVCSLALTLVSQALKEKKNLNVALDMKKNILKAVALKTPLGAKPTAEEVFSVYKEKISEVVIDEKGNVKEDKTALDAQEDENLNALFIYKENGKPVSYAYPIVGQGLWSTLYGYFAVEADAKTVRGITYYDHGETPGLGAEISKDWFQDNFKGKKIWDDGSNTIKPVSVVKGKAADAVSQDEIAYNVDGISGATITAQGVTEMLAREIQKYEPYFSKIRN